MRQISLARRCPCQGNLRSSTVRQMSLASRCPCQGNLGISHHDFPIYKDPAFIASSQTRDIQVFLTIR